MLRKLLILMALLVPLTVASQCITGTPPTLTCGTPISVLDGTPSGQYGTASQSAPSCRSNEKYTYADLYQVTYQPGMVIDVDGEYFAGFLEVLSADGCTSYNCGMVDASGINIAGESFVQDGTSQNGVLRFTIGLDDIGLTPGNTYIIKYTSIANCGGSPCTSATVGTARAYTISCHTELANSCENQVTMSGGTTYNITNEYASDNGADLNGAGIDCGYSIENNLMYYWCTDALNTQVDVQISNLTIHSGTNVQFAILSDDCGGDFTDIQCQSGISADQTFSINNTAANTCYWIAFDGNAGTWFTADITLLDAVVLPIELITFQGNEKMGDTFLYWVTGSETNNDYFLLYWSRDNENWKEIGKVEGSGNTNSSSAYSFTHTSPEEVNYYKLKQVDYDGVYSLSRIIYVNVPYSDINKEYEYINVMGQKVTKDYSGYKIKKENYE
jgi:hypothetical protein